MKYFKFIILACFLSLCILSCGNVEVIFDQKTFYNHWDQWQDKNINNYQYRFNAFGWTHYDGIVFVEDGQFKNDNIIFGDSNMEYWVGYSTIDKIFETIERTYLQNNNTQKSRNEYYLKAIHVKYDNINNIPVDIYYEYDLPKFSNMEIDGTFHFEIKDFSIMD